MGKVRSFFSTIWFVISDTFKSRGEAKKLHGAKRFYRDMTGPTAQFGGQGGAGFNSHRLEQMQDGGLRPDFDDHGQDETDRVI